jgi:hypothetical protein
MKRTLRLRREALTELTPGDLVDVRGGGPTVGDHCGPPFNTTFLDTTALSALGVTGCRFTEATCTW